MHTKFWSENLKGRARRRREDNIRMDLTDTGREVVDWIHLAQDRVQWRAVVRTVMDFWVA